MKKTLTLTESELIKVINRIVESFNDEIYDDEDFVEVFLHYFRPWVRKNHGDEIGEYPLSYLVKKYISDFCIDNGIRPENILVTWRNSLTNASNIGREFVKLGKHKLPSLRSQEKFTERYKKPLEFFIKQLDLPDFMKIAITEDAPFKVFARLEVDWERFIKSEGDRKYRMNEISKELTDKIKSFLGVELGNPTHGQLSFSFHSVEYIGLDEWVKNDLNKVIKKKIKELPDAKKTIHAIKFTTGSQNLGGFIEFSYKDDSWSARKPLKEHIRELLKSMGYNPNYLRVES
jgi:hypothetical protein